MNGQYATVEDQIAASRKEGEPKSYWASFRNGKIRLNVPGCEHAIDTATAERIVSELKNAIHQQKLS